MTKEKNEEIIKEVKKDHTILNLISKALLKNENINFAGYKVDHPLKQNAKFVVKGKNLKKTIKDTISNLINQLDKLEAQIKEW